MYLHRTLQNSDTLDYNIDHSTTWEQSHYWSQKLAGNIAISHGDSVSIVNNTVAYIASVLGENPHLQPIIDTLNVLTSGFIPDNLTHLKYTSELLKEKIFEEVRSSYYSEKPSRTKCMFLFDGTMDPIDYLKKMNFDTAVGTIIEVIPKGEFRLAKCKISLLNCNMSKHNEIIEVAHRYWAETEEQTDDVEILFQGDFKIHPYIRL